MRFSPAIRSNSPLLIGLSGPSGSGKTLSALLLARGLAGGEDSKIALIDTESGRALLYAPPASEAPGERTFRFQCGSLRAPFTPEAYQAAIEAAIAAGASVVVVDSFSHAWVGEGGLHDLHEAELDRLAGDDAARRERLSLTAWKTPKSRNRRLVMALLQVPVHVILCLRAEDRLRLELVEDDRGRKRTIITAAGDLPLRERWVPVCERRLPYELTLSLLLTPENPGVPIPLKVPDGLAALVRTDRPINAETGAALAAWASGQIPTAPQPDSRSPARAAALSALRWNGAELDPAAPEFLALPDGAGEEAVKILARTVRELIARSNSVQANSVQAQAWWSLNRDTIRAHSEKLAAWVRPDAAELQRNDMPTSETRL